MLQVRLDVRGVPQGLLVSRQLQKFKDGLASLRQGGAVDPRSNPLQDPLLTFEVGLGIW